MKHEKLFREIESLEEKYVSILEGERMYGPSVTDCKGGIVASFLAAEALSRCGFEDRPPVEYAERNEALLNRMNEIFKKTDLPELVGIAANGGSDAACVTISGIPCVDSISVRGGLTHNRGEYIITDSPIEAAKRIASVICFI